LRSNQIYMRTFLFTIIFSISFSSFSQDFKEKYLVEIDLINVIDDQLNITIGVPYTGRESVEFHMPKIVPGTYSISDFGRFVTNLNAIDNEGNPLEVARVDVNRWKILGAENLAFISYKVHDTFDKNDNYGDNVIFEPGGSSFEYDRNVYVLNSFALVGYLDGFLSNDFELSIKKPAELYGATSLKPISRSSNIDVFKADNYHFLVDAPLMYTVPDTASFLVANANVMVSVFSPNKRLSANEVVTNLTDLMQAQAQYLGGLLPVDRYAFLIYLMDRSSLSGSMGALEHSYSSVYTLPEANSNQISQTVRDVASHEFFHIVTPLNIHSEQIHNFNYIAPEMSQHLWLYEGVTEYASMHVQAKYGLFTPDQFLEEIKDKMRVSSQFPDVSFTTMSREILSAEYEPMYTNVYYKGALIGLCLDLHLLKYTNGALDLQGLLRQLAKKYGKDLAFKDDQLFEEIVALTTPEIGIFFNKHVIGDEPLPMADCLSWVGIISGKNVIKEVNTLGKVGFSLSENNALMISDISEMNDFGKALGFKVGDELVSLNKMSMSMENFSDTMIKFQELKAGKKVKIEVNRMVDGKSKTIELQGKVQKVKTETSGEISFDPNANSKQLELFKQWIGNNVQ